MREVKFRGKSTLTIDELNDIGINHNDGWVIGNLIGKDLIVGGIIDHTDEYIVHEWFCPVDSETVGQFTGLKDKNGVENFEGDILYDEHYDVHGVITFEEGKFLCESETFSHDLWEVCDDMEIMSNIYDEPELIE